MKYASGVRKSRCDVGEGLVQGTRRTVQQKENEDELTILVGKFAPKR